MLSTLMHISDLQFVVSYRTSEALKNPDFFGKTIEEGEKDTKSLIFTVSIPCFGFQMMREIYLANLVKVPLFFILRLFLH